MGRNMLWSCNPFLASTLQDVSTINWHRYLDLPDLLQFPIESDGQRPLHTYMSAFFSGTSCTVHPHACWSTSKRVSISLFSHSPPQKGQRKRGGGWEDWKLAPVMKVPLSERQIDVWCHTARKFQWRISFCIPMQDKLQPPFPPPPSSPFPLANEADSILSPFSSNGFLHQRVPDLEGWVPPPPNPRVSQPLFPTLQLRTSTLYLHLPLISLSSESDSPRDLQWTSEIRRPLLPLVLFRLPKLYNPWLPTSAKFRVKFYCTWWLYYGTYIESLL